MLRECEGDGNSGVGDVGGVVVMSAGHEYVGVTRGSGIMSITDDVLWMSIVWGGVGDEGASKKQTTYNNTDYTTNIDTNTNTIDDAKIKTNMNTFTPP